MTGLSCHHPPHDAGVSGPKGRHRHPREVDASVGASGPHGFAVRKTGAFVLAPLASTASRPTFVTMANAPPGEAEWRGLVEMICPTGKAEYFSREGWTWSANHPEWFAGVSAKPGFAATKPPGAATGRSLSNFWEEASV